MGFAINFPGLVLNWIFGFQLHFDLVARRFAAFELFFLALAVAEQAGLDGAAAREVIETRSFKDAVDADWQRAREMGITGVPTFYQNDLVVVGCQPYETLERFVKHLLELKQKQAQ